MRQSRAMVLAVLGLAIVTTAALAEDRRSANTMLGACRFEAQQPAPVQDQEWTLAFQCRDSIAILIKNGPKQPAFMSACVPENTSSHVVARAIVDFLEKEPERLGERFDIRGTVALHQAWPCH